MQTCVQVICYHLNGSTLIVIITRYISRNPSKSKQSLHDEGTPTPQAQHVFDKS